MAVWSTRLNNCWQYATRAGANNIWWTGKVMDPEKDNGFPHTILLILISLGTFIGTILTSPDRQESVLEGGVLSHSGEVVSSWVFCLVYFLFYFENRTPLSFQVTCPSSCAPG